METLTQSKLILIAERARRESAYRFTCLAHLLNAGFLKTCYRELDKDRASGMDGISWQEYGKQLDENLKDLEERMRAKRYADDFIGMVQYMEDAQVMIEAMQKRFAAYGLELHPDKTRVISFRKYEEENAWRQGHKANTFYFLGFTHYCGCSRKGNFLLGRRTSGNKFQKRIKEMNQWLKTVRSACQVKEWWPILQAKLRGHYQYYGVSGNYKALCRYYRRTLYLVLKWLNRSGQKSCQGFAAYLCRYPLPIPKIKHSFYTLSFGT